jgi:hypothetical protein
MLLVLSPLPPPLALATVGAALATVARWGNCIVCSAYGVAASLGEEDNIFDSECKCAGLSNGCTLLVPSGGEDREVFGGEEDGCCVFAEGTGNFVRVFVTLLTNSSRDTPETNFTRIVPSLCGATVNITVTGRVGVIEVKEWGKPYSPYDEEVRYLMNRADFGQQCSFPRLSIQSQQDNPNM